jgi:hypothetical protein
MTSGDRENVRNEAELGPLHEAAAKVPDGRAFPVDHSRETPALGALARRGYTAEFLVREGSLRVANSDRCFQPDDVRIRDYYRFEGTSDPDDMSVIYALEARDGTRGTLTDAFGAYADPAVSAVIDQIPVVPFPRARRWPRVVLGGAVGALAVVTALVLARRGAATRGPGSSRRAA